MTAVGLSESDICVTSQGVGLHRPNGLQEPLLQASSLGLLGLHWSLQKFNQSPKPHTQRAKKEGWIGALEILV